jgi:hypothetical protein
LSRRTDDAAHSHRQGQDNCAEKPFTFRARYLAGSEVPQKTRWLSSSSDTAELNEHVCMALLLLLVIVEYVGGRVISLQPRYSTPTVVYSDASYSETSGCKMGMVIFCPNCASRWALSPRYLMQPYIPLVRRRRTSPKERRSHAFLVQNTFLRHSSTRMSFGSWTTLVPGFINGYSADTSLASIVAVMHMFVANLNCRVWCEHCRSECNVSDGLRRD